MVMILTTGKGEKDSLSRKTSYKTGNGGMGKAISSKMDESFTNSTKPISDKIGSPDTQEKRVSVVEYNTNNTKCKRTSTTQERTVKRKSQEL